MSGDAFVDEISRSRIAELTKGLPPDTKARAVEVISGNIERRLALVTARRNHLKDTKRLVRDLPSAVRQGQGS